MGDQAVQSGAGVRTDWPFGPAFSSFISLCVAAREPLAAL
jgi:hypothetical protein